MNEIELTQQRTLIIMRINTIHREMVTYAMESDYCRNPVRWYWLIKKFFKRREKIKALDKLDRNTEETKKLNMFDNPLN